MERTDSPVAGSETGEQAEASKLTPLNCAHTPPPDTVITAPSPRLASISAWCRGQPVR